MPRNPRPDQIGMGGRILSVQVAGSPRNTHGCYAADADADADADVGSLIAVGPEALCGLVLRLLSRFKDVMATKRSKAVVASLFVSAIQTSYQPALGFSCIGLASRP